MNSTTWLMPERRRLGTGESITRSGLTAHWATQRRKSSAQPATGRRTISELSDYTHSHIWMSVSLPYQVDQKMGSRPAGRRRWPTSWTRRSERLETELLRVAGAPRARCSTRSARRTMGLGLYDRAVPIYTQACRVQRGSAEAPTTPMRSRPATTWAKPTGAPAGCPRRSRRRRVRSGCGIRGWAPTTPKRLLAEITSPPPTGRRPHHRGDRLAHRDAQADGDEAGPRPPRHAHQPQQSRRRLPDRRPHLRCDRLDEATLTLREAKLGPDHPETLTSRNNLATAYRRRPHRRGDRPARGHAQDAGVEAGPRPPRHAHQPQQPCRRLPTAGRTPRRSRCTRRRSS